MHPPSAIETAKSGPLTVAPGSAQGELVVSYLGHATTLIDLDATRLLTDPILRTRVSLLRRHGPLPSAEAIKGLDAVLLSHLHLDHTDVVSMNMLPPGTKVLAPVGTRAVLSRQRLPDVREMAPGDTVEVGSLLVTATPAEHKGRRFPWSRHTEALGYVVQGSQKVYFAGDTGLFSEMAGLSDGLDLALLPIWGWGLRLRADHLSPETAARALQMLRPRLAIPIHWGTLLPMGAARRYAHFLLDPPGAFVRQAQTLAPEVECVVLQTGHWVRIRDSRLASKGGRV